MMVLAKVGCFFLGIIVIATSLGCLVPVQHGNHKEEAAVRAAPHTWVRRFIDYSDAVFIGALGSSGFMATEAVMGNADSLNQTYPLRMVVSNYHGGENGSLIRGKPILLAAMWVSDRGGSGLALMPIFGSPWLIDEHQSGRLVTLPSSRPGLFPGQAPDNGLVVEISELEDALSSELPVVMAKRVTTHGGTRVLAHWQPGRIPCHQDVGWLKGVANGVEELDGARIGRARRMTEEYRALEVVTKRGRVRVAAFSNVEGAEPGRLAEFERLWAQVAQ